VKLDTLLTLAALAAAAYALYLAARAPGQGRAYYAGNGSVPGGILVPVPIGYDSGGGPAYG